MSDDKARTARILLRIGLAGALLAAVGSGLSATDAFGARLAFHLLALVVQLGAAVIVVVALRRLSANKPSDAEAVAHQRLADAGDLG